MTERRLRAIVTALVAAISALAFLVSFRAISEFAVQTGAFPARLGWAAPLLVDSFTLAASIEVLRSALAGQRAVYPGPWSPPPPPPRPPSTLPTRPSN
jgi:hypothetical protein